MMNLIKRLAAFYTGKEWDYHYTGSGWVMRRKVNGSYETRPMTDKESRELIDWQSVK